MPQGGRQAVVRQQVGPTVAPAIRRPDAKGEFTGVVDELLLEDFSNEWSLIGAGDPFTGQWNVSQDGLGTDLSPTRTPEEDWVYEQRPVFRGWRQRSSHYRQGLYGLGGWLRRESHAQR